MHQAKPPRPFSSRPAAQARGIAQPSGPARQSANSQPTPPTPWRPLDEAEMAHLQKMLDRVPAPLEPLDVSMLDGYLVGVLLQPKAVPTFDWSRHVLDSEEGRSPPAGFDSKSLIALVKRRYQQLNQAITQRQWFDPWVFELEAEDKAEDGGAWDIDEASPSEVLFPWVAGFSLACELFPDLMRKSPADLLEPLAAIFRHIDPDDLEDADDLLEAIDSMEPAANLDEAVESLVSACLMLADVSRPQAAPTAAQKPPARRGAPARGRSRPTHY
jgi:uncharacterized protein